jgi:hypothetical protein
MNGEVVAIYRIIVIASKPAPTELWNYAPG